MKYSHKLIEKLIERYIRNIKVDGWKVYQQLPLSYNCLLDNKQCLLEYEEIKPFRWIRDLTVCSKQQVVKIAKWATGLNK